MSFKPIPTLDGTQANFTGNITSAGNLTVEGNITMSGSDVLTGVRTVTAGGNTLGAGETLAFGVGGDNIKVTESAGAVTIAVDGSAELPTDTIPNLAASKITSSTFANARISESSVTQHQAALTLASGQITGALGFTPISTETDDQTLDEVLAQGNTSSRNITAGAITGSALTIDTDTLFVDSSNNRVGIGTTSPDELFHVKGSATTLKAKIESTGSNSFPTLRLTNDARTYDLQIDGASDAFRIYDSTGTVERFRITSGGDIGMGVTSPASKLHIADNHSQLRFEDTDDSKFLLHSYSGGKYVVRNNSTSTTVNQFTLTEAGKFGIGTISPDYKLDIGGDTGSADNTIRMVQANNGTAIRIGAGGGSNDVNLLRVDGNTSVNKGESDSSNYGFSLRYKGSGSGANNSLAFFADNSTAGSQIEALSILQDGKVGVGATAPDSLLHLASTGPAVLTIEADTDNATETDNARIVLKQDGALVVGRMGYENNTNALEFINEFNDSLSLGTNNTKRFTITGAGNASFTGSVGINTSSPGQKLHVYQGTAKFESTNGSDNSLQLGRSDVANLWNFNHAGNDLRIYNSGGSGYDVMIGVNSGGSSTSNKVGINTASPSHQLDVNGTFQAVGDATFDANVNAAGVITTGGNTEAEVKSWLHAGRQWSFNGLPGFSKDSGATANRNDGLAPGQLNTGAAASRRALMTLIRNTYNDYGGYSGAGPDYSRAIGASIKLAFAAVGQNSSVIRLLVGSPSSVSSTTYADEDPLSNHGFGVEFRRGSGSTYEWRVFGHNGTSLSASTFTSTGITYTTDPRTIAVYSDGAGNITAYTALYGSTSYTTATTTGGPTATAGGMSTYTSIQVATNDSSYVSGASAKCVFMGANFYAE